MNTQRIIVIIQARMGSTRLPGKVLNLLHHRTVLSHVIQRCQAIRGISEVVVATSELPDDELIAAEATKNNVPYYRGSETNVLSRYVEAAQKYGADAIVRVTSDCPLLDPSICNRVVDAFIEQKVDYGCNTLLRTFPRGLDIEIFTMETLIRTYNEATLDSHKEHVTQYIYQHPEKFTLYNVENDVNYADYRWTLDTEEDWQLIQKIYQELYQPDSLFSWRDVILLMQNRPELHLINAHIEQKKI